METVKIPVIAGGGVGEKNRQSTEDFEGSENTVYDTIMMDACHHT